MAKPVHVAGDLTAGAFGQNELLARDSVTGQRYRAISVDWTGHSSVLGGDLTYGSRAEYLPNNRGIQADFRLSVSAR